MYSVYSMLRRGAAAEDGEQEVYCSSIKFLGWNSHLVSDELEKASCWFLMEHTASSCERTSKRSPEVLGSYCSHTLLILPLLPHSIADLTPAAPDPPPLNSRFVRSSLGLIL